MVLAVDYPAEVPMCEGVFPFFLVDEGSVVSIETDGFSCNHLGIGGSSF